MISFSEGYCVFSITVEVQKKNVLTFTVNVNNNQGTLEALGAHLFILLRKRRRKPRRGKTITLQVMKVADNSSNYDFLTIVRTRVKKTRWQKISLPVTLIQSLLESNRKTLQLKVMCKRCGKSVKPVLKRGTGRNRLRRRRGKLKKKKQRKSRKNKRKNKKKTRSGKTRDSIRPFLVISTRYSYYR
ncbi:hypothetical protein FSP39_021782 [Pinctada imbricata]|uniref:Uncharacterized protein n=1 Tax=Pinctada imbricata TaxID=66713 RepID=A0AA89C738_PINIB|nr:hypothetical protein FSP39_021782 [Pinctada imbricata]